MTGHILSLLEVPGKCFPSGRNGDQKLLKAIRHNAKHYHGFFLVRNLNPQISPGSFLLEGELCYVGRWLLGRVRKHVTQPGRYEILIRRPKTCYYRTVDSDHALAEELRFMDADADAEFSMTEGDWISTPDPMFHELGFSLERA